MFFLKIVVILGLQLFIRDAVAMLPTLIPSPVISDDLKSAVQFLVDMKQHSKTPYRKLTYTYRKFDACGLRHYQKNETCRQIVSSRIYEGMSHGSTYGYNDVSCKKMIVNVADILENSAFKRLVLSAYKCPNFSRAELAFDAQTRSTSTRKVSVPIRLYVSGGVRQNSALVSYQHVGERTDIKPGCAVSKLPIDDLSLMRTSRQEYPYVRNLTGHLSRIPEQEVQRTIDSSDGIFRRPSAAEQSAAYNETIKRMAPYSKFREQFNQSNICSQKKVVLLNLCQQVFETSTYRLMIVKNDAITCSRQNVVLNFRMAEEFTNFWSMLIRCPTPSSTTFSSYFLGSSFENKQPIIYMQIWPFPEILPDAIAYDVQIP